MTIANETLIYKTSIHVLTNYFLFRFGRLNLSKPGIVETSIPALYISSYPNSNRYATMCSCLSFRVITPSFSHLFKDSIKVLSHTKMPFGESESLLLVVCHNLLLNNVGMYESNSTENLEIFKVCSPWIWANIIVSKDGHKSA